MMIHIEMYCTVFLAHRVHLFSSKAQIYAINTIYGFKIATFGLFLFIFLFVCFYSYSSVILSLLSICLFLFFVLFLYCILVSLCCYKCVINFFGVGSAWRCYMQISVCLIGYKVFIQT